MKKIGVSTNTILRATTTKQKADKLKRIQDSRRATKAVRKTYGALRYRCSNCPNTIRFKEKIEERMILCSKCNNGFFKILLKNERN